jgi:UPF0755 protein
MRQPKEGFIARSIPAGPIAFFSAPGGKVSADRIETRGDTAMAAVARPPREKSLATGINSKLIGEKAHAERISSKKRPESAVAKGRATMTAAPQAAGAARSEMAVAGRAASAKAAAEKGEVERHAAIKAAAKAEADAAAERAAAEKRVREQAAARVFSTDAPVGTNVQP